MSNKSLRFTILHFTVVYIAAVFRVKILYFVIVLIFAKHAAKELFSLLKGIL